MRSIFAEEHRLQRLLDVEAALAQAHASVGNIPKEDAQRIAERAHTRWVTLEKVKTIERETHHDIVAIVRVLSEECGEAGAYVHLGATSYDIVDTAWALQIAEAIDLLREGLLRVQRSLLALAERYKATVMIGRTHGQHAAPMTFGLKMAVYVMEMQRHIDRLDEVGGRVCVGKMSGAVGTGAALGPHALQIQEDVMASLHLGVAEATSQIVQRDRHAEFLFVLANIATSAEKFATEVRNLGRTEIGEVMEPFKGVGSSTMPHKRNPIHCERIGGLARVVRSAVFPALENNLLWHERDLTNSSAERILIPHACVLTDEILHLAWGVFEGLEVYPDVMLSNARLQQETMSEAVMTRLVERGVGRQEAFETVRRCAMAAQEKKLQFKDVLSTDTVAGILTRGEIDDALDPTKYVGRSEEITQRVIDAIKKRG